MAVVLRLASRSNPRRVIGNRFMQRVPNENFASLSPAVMRTSTVVFDSFDDFVNRKSRQPEGFSYGITGTPTTRGLERKLAELEGARHCVVTPSGPSALTTTVMGFVRGGDHLLVSAACYGGLKTFAETWLARMNIEVEFYRPEIGAEIEAVIRPNTGMICMESPGTVTMEMQDTPAIAQVARRHGVLTMMDNTWASPLGFRPVEHGVDFRIEAVTKFLGGHPDLLMGSISMNDHGHYAVLREAQSILGQHVSPDDCFLVLRGLETLKIRLAAQSASTLRVARWLVEPSEVDGLLPPLESDPGHAIWKRDFATDGGLFSVTMARRRAGAVVGLHDFKHVRKTSSQCMPRTAELNKPPKSCPCPPPG